MTISLTRPATRAYLTEVARVARLSPNFLRITVISEDLEYFGPAGTQESPDAWDQRIKLFLPRADGTYPEVGLFDDPPAPMMQWYTAWRQLEETQRNPIRTYTVRQIRSAAREVDIDFVIHVEKDGTFGPAAGWATSAAPGDELVVIGPDRRAEQAGGGIDFTPGTARDLLLAGDETAVPAICAILESLPADYHGDAYLEVPTAEDVLSVSSPSEVRIHWLPRDGAPLGSALDAAVADWGQRWAERLHEQMTEQRSQEQELPEVDEDATLWETSIPEGFRICMARR